MSDEIKTNRSLNVYKFNNESSYGDFLTKQVGNAYKDNIVSIVGSQKSDPTSNSDLYTDNTSTGFDLFIGSESISRTKYVYIDNTEANSPTKVIDPDSSYFQDNSPFMISGISRSDDIYHSKMIFLTPYTGATVNEIVDIIDQRYYDMFHNIHGVLRKLYSILYKVAKPQLIGITFNYMPGYYEMNSEIDLTAVKIASIINNPPARIDLYSTADASNTPDTSTHVAEFSSVAVNSSVGFDPSVIALNKADKNGTFANKPYTFYIGYYYDFEKLFRKIDDPSLYDTSILDSADLAINSDYKDLSLGYVQNPYTYMFAYKISAFWTPDEYFTEPSTGKFGQFKKEPSKDDPSVFKDVFEYNSDSSFIYHIMKNDGKYPNYPEFDQCSDNTFVNQALPWNNSTADGNYLYLIQPSDYLVPDYTADGNSFTIDSSILTQEYNGISYTLYRSTSQIQAQKVTIG